MHKRSLKNLSLEYEVADDLSLSAVTDVKTSLVCCRPTVTSIPGNESTYSANEDRRLAKYRVGCGVLNHHRQILAATAKRTKYDTHETKPPANTQVKIKRKVFRDLSLSPLSLSPITPTVSDSRHAVRILRQRASSDMSRDSSQSGTSAWQHDGDMLRDARSQVDSLASVSHINKHDTMLLRASPRRASFNLSRKHLSPMKSATTGLQHDCCVKCHLSPKQSLEIKTRVKDIGCFSVLDGLRHLKKKRHNSTQNMKYKSSEARSDTFDAAQRQESSRKTTQTPRQIFDGNEVTYNNDARCHDVGNARGKYIIGGSRDDFVRTATDVNGSCNESSDVTSNNGRSLLSMRNMWRCENDRQTQVNGRATTFIKKEKRVSCYNGCNSVSLCACSENNHHQTVSDSGFSEKEHRLKVHKTKWLDNCERCRSTVYKNDGCTEKDHRQGATDNGCYEKERLPEIINSTSATKTPLADSMADSCETKSIENQLNIKHDEDSTFFLENRWCLETEPQILALTTVSPLSADWTLSGDRDSAFSYSGAGEKGGDDISLISRDSRSGERLALVLQDDSLPTFYIGADDANSTGAIFDTDDRMWNERAIDVGSVAGNADKAAIGISVVSGSDSQPASSCARTGNCASAVAVENKDADVSSCFLMPVSAETFSVENQTKQPSKLLSKSISMDPPLLSNTGNANISSAHLCESISDIQKTSFCCTNSHCSQHREYSTKSISSNNCSNNDKSYSSSRNYWQSKSNTKLHTERQSGIVGDDNEYSSRSNKDNEIATADIAFGFKRHHRHYRRRNVTEQVDEARYGDRMATIESSLAKVSLTTTKHVRQQKFSYESHSRIVHNLRRWREAITSSHSNRCHEMTKKRCHSVSWSCEEFTYTVYPDIDAGLEEEEEENEDGIYCRRRRHDQSTSTRCDWEVERAARLSVCMEVDEDVDIGMKERINGVEEEKENDFSAKIHSANDSLSQRKVARVSSQSNLPSSVVALPPRNSSRNDRSLLGAENSVDLHVQPVIISRVKKYRRDRRDSVRQDQWSTDGKHIRDGAQPEALTSRHFKHSRDSDGLRVLNKNTDVILREGAKCEMKVQNKTTASGRFKQREHVSQSCDTPESVELPTKTVRRTSRSIVKQLPKDSNNAQLRLDPQRERNPKNDDAVTASVGCSLRTVTGRRSIQVSQSSRPDSDVVPLSSQMSCSADYYIGNSFQIDKRRANIMTSQEESRHVGQCYHVEPPGLLTYQVSRSQSKASPDRFAQGQRTQSHSMTANFGVASENKIIPEYTSLYNTLPGPSGQSVTYQNCQEARSSRELYSTLPILSVPMLSCKMSSQTGSKLSPSDQIYVRESFQKKQLQHLNSQLQQLQRHQLHHNQQQLQQQPELPRVPQHEQATTATFTASAVGERRCQNALRTITNQGPVISRRLRDSPAIKCLESVDSNIASRMSLRSAAFF